MSAVESDTLFPETTETHFLEWLIRYTVYTGDQDFPISDWARCRILAPRLGGESFGKRSLKLDSLLYIADSGGDGAEAVYEVPSAILVEWLPLSDSTLRVDLECCCPGADDYLRAVVAEIEHDWPKARRLLGETDRPALSKGPSRKRLEMGDDWDWKMTKVAEYEEWLCQGLSKDGAAQRVKGATGDSIPRNTLESWRKRVRQIEGPATPAD